MHGAGRNSLEEAYAEIRDRVRDRSSRDEQFNGLSILTDLMAEAKPHGSFCMVQVPPPRSDTPRKLSGAMTAAALLERLEHLEAPELWCATSCAQSVDDAKQRI